MPKIFTTLDKIKPAYDITYKVVLFICKILLIADTPHYHHVGHRSLRPVHPGPLLV